MSDGDKVPVRRALFSVSDKTGLVDFASALAERGVALVASGGTARTLADAGLAVSDVSELTGYPEMMDGRVKTLHPAVHGGILARRDLAAHREAMEANGIAPIDLVAVNLYPFEETVAGDAERDEAVEQIDIGGPALIRAAAKNHAFVVVATDPEDYTGILRELAENDGRTTLDFRKMPRRRRLCADRILRRGDLAMVRPRRGYPVHPPHRVRRNPRGGAALRRKPPSGSGPLPRAAGAARRRLGHRRSRARRSATTIWAMPTRRSSWWPSSTARPWPSSSTPIRAGWRSPIRWRKPMRALSPAIR